MPPDERSVAKRNRARISRYSAPLWSHYHLRQFGFRLPLTVSDAGGINIFN
jgi:hypothetical protein